MKKTVLALFLFAATSALAEEPKVVFMCPYGGAKSVVAASYFDRAAKEAGLPHVGIAVAAETPYEAVPPKVAGFLKADGFDVTAFKPRKVTPDDLRSAARVVSIDCDLTKLDAHGAKIEEWNDVPKISEDLPGSVAAIRKHVETLIADLKELATK